MPSQLPLHCLQNNLLHFHEVNFLDLDFPKYSKWFISNRKHVQAALASCYVNQLFLLMSNIMLLRGHQGLKSHVLTIDHPGLWVQVKFYTAVANAKIPGSELPSCTVAQLHHPDHSCSRRAGTSMLESLQRPAAQDSCFVTLSKLLGCDSWQN